MNFFIHIPKTAGTSFGHYLRSQFKPTERELRLDSPEIIKSFADSSASQTTRIAGGHITRTHVEKNLANDELNIFSIVRDPVERLKSNVNFHFVYEARHGRKSNFLRGDYRDVFEKSGVNGVLEKIYEEHIRDDGSTNFAKLNDVQYKYLKASDVSVASDTDFTKSLAGLSVVGTVEDYHRSLLLISNCFGLIPPFVEPAANINAKKKSETLSDELIDLYLKRDYICYDAVKERFEKDFENLCQELGAEKTEDVRLKLVEKQLDERATHKRETNALKADPNINKRSHFLATSDGAWCKSSRGIAVDDSYDSFQHQHLWVSSGKDCSVWLMVPESGEIVFRGLAPYVKGTGVVTVSIADFGDVNKPAKRAEKVEKKTVELTGKPIRINRPDLGSHRVELTFSTEQSGRVEWHKSHNYQPFHNMENVVHWIEFLPIDKSEKQPSGGKIGNFFKKRLGAV